MPNAPNPLDFDEIFWEFGSIAKIESLSEGFIGGLEMQIEFVFNRNTYAHSSPRSVFSSKISNESSFFKNYHFLLIKRFWSCCQADLPDQRIECK